MKPVRIWITGPPGVGKTTLVERVVRTWKASGKPVQGFFTREIREKGKRVGFELVLLPEELRFLLAHVHPIGSARLGRYSLAFGGLQAALARLAHLDSSALVVVDEVGPMELRYHPFRAWVQRGVFPPLFLATFQMKLEKTLKAWGCLEGEILRLSRENRDRMADEVLHRLGFEPEGGNAHGRNTDPQR